MKIKHINEILGATQSKSIRCQRMSKFDGDIARQSIAVMLDRVKAMPKTTGRDGKAYLLYTIRKSNGWVIKYYITAFNPETRFVEGICDSGSTYPFNFNFNLKEILEKDAILEMRFSPCKPDFGMR